jgi:hypothetical protein
MRLDLSDVIGWDTETPRLPEDPESKKFRLTDYVTYPVCATFAGGPETYDKAFQLAEALGEDALLQRATSTVVTRTVGTVQMDEWKLLVTGPREAIAATVEYMSNCRRFVAHNQTFDWTVVAYSQGHDVREATSSEWAKDFLDTFEEGRFCCTMVREMLDANAKDRFRFDPRVGGQPTRFSLAHITKARFGEDLSAEKKDPDAWRLRYGELEGVPAQRWPKKAVDYAMMDAVWARRIYLDQAHAKTFMEGELTNADGDITNEAAQGAKALWGHWMQCVGLNTDPEASEEFEREAIEGLAEANNIARRMGFLAMSPCKECAGTGLIGEVPELVECPTCRGVPKGAKAKKPAKYMKRLKEWVSWAYYGQPPKTDKGNVKTDNDTLARCRVKGLRDYASLGSHAKLVSTYAPILRSAANSGGILRYSFNHMVASGRTSKRGPNMQNPPRQGGFRGCFIPRPGMVWASVDYSFLELCTVAQACLELVGYSRLAEAINAGLDPHLDFGRKLLTTNMIGMKGVTPTYEEAVAMKKASDPLIKKARQFAKVPNFGAWGGLGATTLIDYGRATYGVELTPSEAEMLIDAWRRQWPETTDYFEHISSLVPRRGDRCRVQQLYSGRLRDGCSYTAACNTYFQGLAADGAAYAGWQLNRAMHTPGNPLSGCRIVMFIHDEFVVEGPEETAHLWAEEVSRIMVEAMKYYVPDVRIEAPPALMRRWYKDADPVYVDGKLVPWEPT